MGSLVFHKGTVDQVKGLAVEKHRALTRDSTLKRPGRGVLYPNVHGLALKVTSVFKEDQLVVAVSPTPLAPLAALHQHLLGRVQQASIDLGSDALLGPTR